MGWPDFMRGLEDFATTLSVSSMSLGKVTVRHGLMIPARLAITRYGYSKGMPEVGKPRPLGQLNDVPTSSINHESRKRLLQGNRVS